MVISTSIEVVNRKYEELTGQEQVMHVRLVFDINDVSAIRETIDDDDTEPNPDKCQIYLKCGEYFTIFTPYKLLVELWQKQH